VVTGSFKQGEKLVMTRLSAPIDGMVVAVQEEASTDAVEGANE
jgi:hypothetical protein